MARQATVTVTNSKTPLDKLKSLCRQADVVVAAVGIPRFVKADWLKPGALAINVGTTFSPQEKRMVGDIDMAGIDTVGLNDSCSFTILFICYHIALNTPNTVRQPCDHHTLH